MSFSSVMSGKWNTVSSRIWTWITNFISGGGNHYTKRVSQTDLSIHFYFSIQFYFLLTFFSFFLLRRGCFVDSYNNYSRLRQHCYQPVTLHPYNKLKYTRKKILSKIGLVYSPVKVSYLLDKLQRFSLIHLFFLNVLSLVEEIWKKKYGQGFISGSCFIV